MGFYAATKAALLALTKVMAAEFAPLGVRVNVLAPGSHHSDLFDSAAQRLPGFLEGAADSAIQKRVAETEEIVGPYELHDFFLFFDKQTEKKTPAQIIEELYIRCLCRKPTAKELASVRSSVGYGGRPVRISQSSPHSERLLNRALIA